MPCAVCRVLCPESSSTWAQSRLRAQNGSDDFAFDRRARPPLSPPRSWHDSCAPPNAFSSSTARPVAAQSGQEVTGMALGVVGMSFMVISIILYCIWPALKQIRLEHRHKRVHSVLIKNGTFRESVGGFSQGNTFQCYRRTWYVSGCMRNVAILAPRQLPDTEEITGDTVIALATQIQKVKIMQKNSPSILRAMA